MKSSARWRRNAIESIPEGARRILRFLRERVSPLADPRVMGEALTGPKLGRLWKYRVGDHCVIASIEDDAVLILVVKIGHRREVYR